jgi:DNA repair exonuclease SbcCD ATPase subunit
MAATIRSSGDFSATFDSKFQAFQEGTDNAFTEVKSAQAELNSKLETVSQQLTAISGTVSQQLAALATMISVQYSLKEPVGVPVSTTQVMSGSPVVSGASIKGVIDQGSGPKGSFDDWKEAGSVFKSANIKRPEVKAALEALNQQVDQFNDEEKHVEEDAKYEEDEDQFNDAPIKLTVVEGSDKDGSGSDEMGPGKVADVDADLQQFQERIQQPLQSKQHVSWSGSTQPLLTLTTTPVGPFIHAHKIVIQPAVPLSRNRRERKIWDPGIMFGKIFKQHLEDKVFLGAGVMI